MSGYVCSILPDHSFPIWLMTHFDTYSLKGFVQNEGTVVTSLIDRDSVQSSESETFVANTFSGSLPGFLAAFFNGKTISDEEAEELKKLIDSYRG